MKLLLVILLILITIFCSCATQKETGKKYAVRKVEKLAGLAWLVTCDSFTVVVIRRGMGKYNPDSITAVDPR